MEPRLRRKEREMTTSYGPEGIPTHGGLVYGLATEAIARQGNKSHGPPLHGAARFYCLLPDSLQGWAVQLVERCISSYPTPLSVAAKLSRY